MTEHNIIHEKEAKTMLSACKSMGTYVVMLKDAYWSSVSHKGTQDITNAAWYLLTLQTLCHALCEKRLGKKKFILQHSNA
jgi:hypothetical protein